MSIEELVHEWLILVFSKFRDKCQLFYTTKNAIIGQYPTTQLDGELVPFSVLATKLYKPLFHPGLVSRSSLTRQLNDGLSKKLTLISAPAGYGKTTLLSAWIVGCKRPVAWLTLDRGDNEPMRFWRYVNAALQTVDNRLGESLRPELFSSIQPLILEQIITDLINNIATIEKELIFVLEDYHLIENAEIHASVNFLIDRLPPQMHLVITTRSDPPLHLPLWRGRAQMTEIRAVDLRFTLGEATSFINQTMQLRLNDQEIDLLEEHTEGWIAGLQMAALALKGISQTRPEEISFFVRNFAGSNRYILDYLVEEVLNNQPNKIQDFLLQTSILESLSGPLCDAVTGIHSRTEKGNTPILEYLERSNLFLVSLDPDRLWYRYHRLFTDLLRAKLEQSTPHLVSELHKRASEWYEQNQYFPEAIDHALEALDYRRACRLIETLVEERMRAQSGIAPIWIWTRRLPQEIVMTRPWLCIMQAMLAMFLNDVDSIEPFLKAAEDAFHLDDRPDLHKTWQGHIACLRAYVADVHNDVPCTIEMAHLALGSLQPDETATRAFAKYLLGRAHYICGDFPKALATLTENVRESIDESLTNLIAPSLSLLSIIYRAKGMLRESQDLLADGRAYVENIDPRRVTFGGLAFVGQAILLHEWNDLDEAERIIRRSLALCEPWASPSVSCRCYMVLVRVLQSQGKITEAADILRLAEESIRGRSPFPEVLSDLDAVRVGFWLATGQLAKAYQWGQEWQKIEKPNVAFSIPIEQNEITLARVLLAEENFDAALLVLDQLAPAAESGGRLGHLIQIYNLQALAFHGQGKQLLCLETLDKSLSLARPGGYIRTFVDEGERMREFLQAFTFTIFSENKFYAQKLLKMFATPGRVGTTVGSSSNLVEPLTARELEILQAMAEGDSNRQIAEKFVLAEGTVKFYVHAVLMKLNVHSRTQAIVEAKKQKII